jgi:hypothetical protein
MIKVKIAKLHPTLKACSCGFIGSKSQYWKHYETRMTEFDSIRDFYKHHGEVPLNEDDPRVQVVDQLKRSLEKVTTITPNNVHIASPDNKHDERNLE